MRVISFSFSLSFLFLGTQKNWVGRLPHFQRHLGGQRWLLGLESIDLIEAFHFTSPLFYFCLVWLTTKRFEVIVEIGNQGGSG